MEPTQICLISSVRIRSLTLQTTVYCEWDDGKEDGWLSDSNSSSNAGIVESHRQEIIDLLVEGGGMMLARDAINKPHHHLQLAPTATRWYAATNFVGRRGDFQLVSKLYERRVEQAGRVTGDDTHDHVYSLRSILDTIPLSAWDDIIVARVLRTGVKVSKAVIIEIQLDLERRETYAAIDDEESVLGPPILISCVKGS
jgi:hypothetical protein